MLSLSLLFKEVYTYPAVLKHTCVFVCRIVSITEYYFNGVLPQNSTNNATDAAVDSWNTYHNIEEAMSDTIAHLKSIIPLKTIGRKHLCI